MGTIIGRKQAVLVVGALLLVGACSSGSDGTVAQPGQGTVPMATLRPPTLTLPEGVTQLCTGSVQSVMRTIVGPFHGAVPPSEYRGTTFAVLLGASLNNCSSHAEWLTAADSAVPGYRELIDNVFNTACSVLSAADPAGGSGAVTPPKPRSCRSETSSPTTVP